jgi:hypothetical protein
MGKILYITKCFRFIADIQNIYHCNLYPITEANMLIRIVIKLSLSLKGTVSPEQICPKVIYLNWL